MKNIFIYIFAVFFFSINSIYAVEYVEPPVLLEKVKSGELPPISERLPDEPLVVKAGVITSEEDLPNWEPGKYGGIMRFGHSNANWNPDVFIMLNEHVLIGPGISPLNPIGNIFLDYKISNNNTTFTFTLRKGLRWSDGVEVTTEDVRYVFEDVYNNEKINPVFPAKFKSGGDPAGKPVEIIYDGKYQFTMKFDAPYGGLVSELSIKGWQGYTDILRPSHHLKGFHPKYTPMEKLQPEIEKLGFKDEWWQYYNSVDCTNWELTKPCSKNYPSLWPWIMVDINDEVMSFERNPYYHKVDTLGQQLPYIDEVMSQLVGDTDSTNIKILAGEIDMTREDTALVRMPLYREAEDKGLIKAHVLDMHVNPTSLKCNYSIANENDRKVMNNLKFRKALNLAINRDEILENIYFNMGEKPKYGQVFDPSAAEDLLDEIGMKRGPEGFRLGPDGKIFDFTLEYQDAAPDIKFVAELLTEHFKAIGIQTRSRLMEATLYDTTGNNNEGRHCRIIWSVEPMWEAGTWTDYIPEMGESTLWRKWYDTNGKEGEEPPEAMKSMMKLHKERGSHVPYSPRDRELFEEIISNMHENLWVIEMLDDAKYILITNPNMGNVQSSGQAIGANNSGEQLFYR